MDDFNGKMKSITNHETIAYTKEDIKSPTAFELIPDSKAMFVPSYNTSIFTLVGASLTILDSSYSFSLNDYIDLVNREFEYRERRLFEELDKSPRKFLMCHFHKIDLIQHLEQEEHEELVKSEYKKIDELAEKIEKKSDYDTVIFMSDHGVPTLESHNKNAFYSSNRELFEDSTPHITDFFSLFVSEKPTESLEDIEV